MPYITVISYFHDIDSKKQHRTTIIGADDQINKRFQCQSVSFSPIISIILIVIDLSFDQAFV